MSDAEDIAKDPSSEVLDTVAKVADVAAHTQSVSFCFCLADDGSKYEVRAWPDEAYTITPVNDAGDPIGRPVSPGANVPYLVGDSFGVGAPTPPSLRDQIRAEERGKRAAIASVEQAQLEIDRKQVAAERAQITATKRELDAEREEPFLAEDPEPEPPQKQRGKLAAFFGVR